MPCREAKQFDHRQFEVTLSRLSAIDLERGRHKMDSKREAALRITAEGREYVRTPDACFENLEGYEFSPNYVEVNGLRVHYLDEGPSRDDVIRWRAVGCSSTGIPTP